MASVRDTNANYKSNVNKYMDAMKDVVTKEVIRAFYWLYKGGHQHVGDYLKDMKQKYDIKPKLNGKQKKRLENKEPVIKMDISLLYILIQHTCGLKDAEDSIWNNPGPSDKNSLEHTFYRIKEERNEIHEVLSLSVTDIPDLKSKIDNLRWLCCNMLSEAGRISGRFTDITKYTDKVEQELSTILGINSERFVQLAREEKKIISSSDPNVCDIGYLAPMARHDGNLVELKTLLHLRTENGSSPNIILITGDAGAGKTSLTRYMDQSWVEEWKDSLCDVCDFDLVLLVPCNTVSTTDGDVVRLLREDLLPDTANCCDPYTLCDILFDLKILWILDGLEEGTPQAADLIDNLVKKQAMGSMIMVTSRPEHSIALTAQFENKTILNINLCGVDPEAMIRRLQINSNPDRASHLDITQTIEYFNKLNKEIKEELQNPLKMQLLIEDIENRQLDNDAIGFNLTQLYQKHKDKQLKKLVEKITKSHITERAVKRKVDKWFSVLCNVAFDRVKDQRISDYNLSSSELKKLEDECDNLGLSSPECLSTFLSHPSSLSSADNPKYNFYHSTQQHFLAALYVSLKIGESNNIKADFCMLFGIINDDMRIRNEHESLVHFYETLLQLVAIYTAVTVTEENKVAELIQVLDHIISTMNSFDKFSKWFEVIQRGSYNPIVLEEISKVIPNVWCIGNYTIEAARHMLQHKTPHQVILELDMSNDKEDSKLLPFLQLLAHLCVIVSLCDKPSILGKPCRLGCYLRELCSEDSQCVIHELVGCLNYEEYDFLRQPMIADNCKYLNLAVKSIEDLKELCNIIEDDMFLNTLELGVDFIDPSFTCEFPEIPDYVNLSIILPHVKDESATAAAKLVSYLSGVYSEITLYQVTDKGAEIFVKKLKKEWVKVKRLNRNVESDKQNVQIELNYGPLPLRYPLQDFKWYWRDLKKYFSDLPKIQKYFSAEQ